MSSLNYVGFRKLLKKARKQLGKDACKDAGMPMQEQLKARSFYLERGPHESAETHAFFLAVEVRRAWRCAHRHLWPTLQAALRM